MRDIFANYLKDDEQLAKWFGQYVTDPKHPELEQAPEETITVDQLREALSDGDMHFCRNEGSRFSYHVLGDNRVQLFADGESFICTNSATLATTLCQTNAIVINEGEWPDEQLELLVQLFNQGSIYCD